MPKYRIVLQRTRAPEHGYVTVTAPSRAYAERQALNMAWSRHRAVIWDAQSGDTVVDVYVTEVDTLPQTPEEIDEEQTVALLDESLKH